MKYRYSLTCSSGHTKVITGPFTRLRVMMWWRKHGNCAWLIKRNSYVTEQRQDR